MFAIYTPGTLSRRHREIGMRVCLLMELSTYLVVIVVAHLASSSWLEAFDPSSTSILVLLACSLSVLYVPPYSRQAMTRLVEVLDPWVKVHVFE